MNIIINIREISRLYNCKNKFKVHAFVKIEEEIKFHALPKVESNDIKFTYGLNS